MNDRRLFADVSRETLKASFSVMNGTPNEAFGTLRRLEAKLILALPDAVVGYGLAGIGVLNDGNQFEMYVEKTGDSALWTVIRRRDQGQAFSLARRSVTRIRMLMRIDIENDRLLYSRLDSKGASWPPVNKAAMALLVEEAERFWETPD